MAEKTVEEYAAERRRRRNEYMRDYRRRNPLAIERVKYQDKLRRRALSALAERHPEEYAALYDEVVAAALAAGEVRP